MDNTSPAWNKGRAWIEGAKKEVVGAYAKQSEEDLIAFLQCRREEIVEGGILFILMGGRPGSLHPQHQLGDPDSRAKHPFTSSMDQAWEDLLNEVCTNYYNDIPKFFVKPSVLLPFSLLSRLHPPTNKAHNPLACDLRGPSMIALFTLCCEDPMMTFFFLLKLSSLFF